MNDFLLTNFGLYSHNVIVINEDSDPIAPEISRHRRPFFDSVCLNFWVFSHDDNSRCLPIKANQLWPRTLTCNFQSTSSECKCHHKITYLIYSRIRNSPSQLLDIFTSLQAEVVCMKGVLIYSRGWPCFKVAGRNFIDGG